MKLVRQEDRQENTTLSRLVAMIADTNLKALDSCLKRCRSDRPYAERAVLMNNLSIKITKAVGTIQPTLKFHQGEKR